MNEGFTAGAHASTGEHAATERELQMMTEAITMVASGASPRVVVAGIHHAPAIIDRVQRLALEAGVRVRALRHDDSGADLAVEPIKE
jgi:hypothetical protein